MTLKALPTVAAASLALGLLGTGPVALASAAPKASHVTLLSTAASYHVGSAIMLSGRATPVTRTAVALQRLVGKKWVTVAHAKPSSKGAFTFAVTAPGKPVTWQLRALRGASTGIKGGVSATVKTRVVKAIYAISSSITVSGQAVTVTGKVTPKATGSVLLQALSGKTWTKIASAKLTAASTFVFTVNRPVGTAALRVLRAATPAVAGKTGATLHATVVPPTGATPPTGKPALAITSAILPEGVVGADYSQQLTAVNGTAPYTWSAAAGALPTGLTLSAAGVLSGVVPSVVSTSFAVAVTDAAQGSATALISVRFSLSPSATNSVLTWGLSVSGAVGIPGVLKQPVPGTVTALLGVVAVTAGAENGYAVRFDGSVWAWGDNDFQQLGTSVDVASHPSPRKVPGLSNIIEVAAGRFAVMALRSDGTVWTWGDNEFGQAGDGTASNSGRPPAPVQVVGLPTIVGIAEGDQTSYALAADGTIWDWGDNSVGQLGNGLDDNSLVPTHVPNLANVVAIDASGLEAVVLKGDGTVWNWGGDLYGELGFIAPQVFWSNAPVQVTQLSGIKSVAAGWYDTYAVAGDGTVWSWGRNDDGELGNDATTGRGPVHLSLSGVASLSAANEVVCATMADGTLRTWGRQGDSLLLGTGEPDNAPSPVTPPTTGHVSSCDLGQYVGFAVVNG